MRVFPVTTAATASLASGQSGRTTAGKRRVRCRSCSGSIGRCCACRAPSRRGSLLPRSRRTFSGIRSDPDPDKPRRFRDDRAIVHDPEDRKPVAPGRIQKSFGADAGVILTALEPNSIVSVVVGDDRNSAVPTREERPPSRRDGGTDRRWD